jgi:hypothetical protein
MQYRDNGFIIIGGIYSLIIMLPKPRLCRTV